MIETKPFDPADILKSEEAVAAYLEEALATGDAGFIAESLGVVARARGMTDVARKAGLGRETPYKALSATGNPELSTVLDVLKALGYRLSIEPAAPA